MSTDNKKLKVCPKIIHTTVGNGGINLEWTEVPGAEKYAVKRSDSSNGEYEIVKWVHNTVYTDKAVKENKTYWYRIIAQKKLDRRSSKTSSPIAAKVSSTIPAPSDIKASCSSKGNIKLKWKAPDNVNGFVVNRRNDFFEQIIPVAKVKEKEYIDKDVISGQVYHYSIQSIVETPTETKEGNFSKEIFCVFVDRGELIEAKSAAFKKVYLKARIVAGADGYIFERSEDGEEFYEIGRTKSGTDIRLTDKAEKMFTAYYYRVRAYKNVDGIEFKGESSKKVKVKTR